MIAFIDDHRGEYGVEPICSVVPIAPSTYRAHIAKRRDRSLLSDRAKRDAQLRREIARVFEENSRIYGARTIAPGRFRCGPLHGRAPDEGNGDRGCDARQNCQDNGAR